MNLEIEGLYNKKNVSGYITVDFETIFGKQIKRLFEEDAIQTDDEGGYGEIAARTGNNSIIYITESSGKTTKDGRTRFAFWKISLDVAGETGFDESKLPTLRPENKKDLHWINSRLTIINIGEQYQEVIQRFERRKKH